MTLKWYVLKRGNEFRLANFDPQGAQLWMRKGWQLGNRPFDTREEAEKYRNDWQQHPEYPPR